MPFRNPILAGLALIREAIRSPDYSPGVSGWSINRDGTAEFNDIAARGEVLVQGADGSQIVAYADPSLGAVIILTPPSLGGDPTGRTVLMQAYGDPGALTVATGDRLRVTQRLSGVGGPFPGGHLQYDGNLYAGSRDIGRGLVASTLVNTSSLGVTTAITPVMTGSVTLQPGRTYELKWRGGVKSSADGVLAFYRVVATPGSVILGEGLRFRTSGTPVMNVEWSTKFRYTRNVAAPFTLTVQASASAGTIDDFGSATVVRGFELFDVGSASDPDYAAYVELT